ncbi:MAG: PadR family transcriptional regulator [Ktedonobacterales bacterium]
MAPIQPDTGNQPDPETMPPLPPAAFHILLTLGMGERHGYAIMQEVKRLSDGRVRLGPGTLYRMLKGLLDDGLIAESDARPDPAHDDERRRYYRLTDLGQRVVRAEIRRLARLVTYAQAMPGWQSGQLSGGLPASQEGW